LAAVVEYGVAEGVVDWGLYDDLVAGVAVGLDAVVEAGDDAGAGEDPVALDALPGVAFGHPVDHAVVVAVGAAGVAVDWVGGALLYGGDYLGGAGEVHVGYPHGEDVVVSAHLLGVAPLAGACSHPVYYSVEVIHHATHR